MLDNVFCQTSNIFQHAHKQMYLLQTALFKVLNGTTLNIDMANPYLVNLMPLMTLSTLLHYIISFIVSA